MTTKTAPQLLTSQGELFGGESVQTFASTGRPVTVEDAVDLSGTVASDVGKLAMEHAQQRGSVTADDLHEYGIDLHGRDPRIFGAVLNGLAKRGFLHAIGYEHTSR